MDTLRLDLFGEVGDQAPDTAEYMGFWRRVGARAIDTAFHWLITFVVVFVVGVHLFIRQQNSGTPAAPTIELMGQRTFMAIVFSLVGSVMYGAIAEGFHGSTLGKRLLGMVVLHENKVSCGFLAALGRNLVFFLDSIFFGIVGGYAMSANHRDQRYGDQWCKTVVVKRTSVPPAVLRSNLRFLGVLLLSAAVDGLVLLYYYENLKAG